MALLCGACTFHFVYYNFNPLIADGESLEAMLATSPNESTIIVLLVGGLPTLLGLFSVWRGCRMLSSSRRVGRPPSD